MASSLRADQIRHLFEEVVDLDAEARAAYLDRAYRDHRGLREEVEALLAASRHVDAVRKSPAARTTTRAECVLGYAGESTNHQCCAGCCVDCRGRLVAVGVGSDAELSR